jgi:hypothetical protein
VTPIGLGFRAMRGGAVVVAVAVADGSPRVVLSSFLPMAAEGDRLAFEPYTVAFEMDRGPDGTASVEAVAAVAEGRERQQRIAASGLAELVAGLRTEGNEPAVAALLVNRAEWITDVLAHSLSAPEHPPVAEGLAVRDAVRFALDQAGIETAEIDEKSLSERASDKMGVTQAELDSRIKALGADAGRPWRKEQKLACLAAWFALRHRHPELVEGPSSSGRVTSRPDP